MQRMSQHDEGMMGRGKERRETSAPSSTAHPYITLLGDWLRTKNALVCRCSSKNRLSKNRND